MTDALLSALTEKHTTQPAWPHAPYWFCMAERGMPRVSEIKRAVSKHYGVAVLDMMSERRTKDLVIPRQVAIYLAKTLTLKSLPTIGRQFRRDHTTILHAVRRVERSIKTDVGLAADVAELEQIFA